jgi:hypothetical protein
MVASKVHRVVVLVEELRVASVAIITISSK